MEEIRKIGIEDWNEVEQIVRSRTSIQLEPLSQDGLEMHLKTIKNQLSHGAWPHFAYFRNDKMLAWRSFCRWPTNEDVTLLNIYTLANTPFERNEYSGRPQVIIDMANYALDYFRTRHIKRIWSPRPDNPKWQLQETVPGSKLLDSTQYKAQLNLCKVLGTTHDVVNIRTGKIIPKLQEKKDFILGWGSTNPRDQIINLFTDLHAVPWPETGPISQSTDIPRPDPSKTVIEFPEINT